MQRKDYQSLFLQQVTQRGWLNGIEIFLLDVGASGGIDWFWNQFRPHLRAVGFDPLVSKVNRLNSEESDPKISYEAAWISDGTNHTFPDGCKRTQAITTSRLAITIKNCNYAQKYFNRGQELIYPDRILRLDDFEQYLRCRCCKDRY